MTIQQTAPVSELLLMMLVVINNMTPIISGNTSLLLVSNANAPYCNEICSNLCLIDDPNLCLIGYYDDYDDYYYADPEECVEFCGSYFENQITSSSTSLTKTTNPNCNDICTSLYNKHYPVNWYKFYIDLCNNICQSNFHIIKDGNCRNPIHKTFVISQIRQWYNKHPNIYDIHISETANARIEGQYDNNPHRQDIINIRYNISETKSMSIRLHLNLTFIDTVPRSKWNIENVQQALYMVTIRPCFSVYLSDLQVSDWEIHGGVSKSPLWSDRYSESKTSIQIVFIDEHRLAFNLESEILSVNGCREDMVCKYLLSQRLELDDPFPTQCCVDVDGQKGINMTVDVPFVFKRTS
eukprot:27895_1